MLRRRRLQACAGALLTLAAASSAAQPCAFDGGPAADLFDGDFFAVHPQASVVYFAITDAVAQGVLERSAFGPIEPGPAGYWRAAGRVNALHRKLAAAAERSGGASPAIALLLIESNLWARLAPGPQGLTLSMHATGARPGDTVVATSEAGLAAVLEGRLPAATALERGLIAVDRRGSAGPTVAELIAAALTADPAGAAAAPVRLFGPAR